MLVSRRGALRLGMLGATAMLCANSRARAATDVRIGVLKFGTVSWELDTLKHHKFDAANGIDLDIGYFAGEDATNIALLADAIDVMVSDWLWVSRQRSEGSDVTMVPYSTSVGAIMVAQDSPISSLADIKSKRIGVAGGPIDKSWLLLQALSQRDYGFDLAASNEVVYGAPPLLAEKALEGELDAVLNFWHFCARLEAKGFRRVIGANDAAIALGASGPISALGYIFHEAWAISNPTAASGLVRASAQAKDLLAKSNEEWVRLAPLVRAEGKELETLRDRYREGIPRRPVAEEAVDAGKLYRVLAEIGGAKLVGKSADMAPGTYWSGLPQ
jgi:NitT/TauT family transport system substrate-binding protein